MVFFFSLKEFHLFCSYFQTSFFTHIFSNTICTNLKYLLDICNDTSIAVLFHGMYVSVTFVIKMKRYGWLIILISSWCVIRGMGSLTIKGFVLENAVLRKCPFIPEKRLLLPLTISVLCSLYLERAPVKIADGVTVSANYFSKISGLPSTWQITLSFIMQTKSFRGTVRGLHVWKSKMAAVPWGHALGAWKVCIL